MSCRNDILHNSTDINRICKQSRQHLYVIYTCRYLPAGCVSTSFNIRFSPLLANKTITMLNLTLENRNKLFNNTIFKYLN